MVEYAFRDINSAVPDHANSCAWSWHGSESERSLGLRPNGTKPKKTSVVEQEDATQICLAICSSRSEHSKDGKETHVGHSGWRWKPRMYSITHNISISKA